MTGAGLETDEKDWRVRGAKVGWPSLKSSRDDMADMVSLLSSRIGAGKRGGSSRAKRAGLYIALSVLTMWVPAVRQVDPSFFDVRLFQSSDSLVIVREAFERTRDLSSLSIDALWFAYQGILMGRG